LTKQHWPKLRLAKFWYFF